MAEFYARIHPLSNYASQDPGAPFPVCLNPLPTDGYYWKGGPGGQYCHSDLQLYIKEGDELLLCPRWARNGEPLQVVSMILQDTLEQAERGDLDPDWAARWAEQHSQKLAEIAAAAKANYRWGG